MNSAFGAQALLPLTNDNIAIGYQASKSNKNLVIIMKAKLNNPLSVINNDFVTTSYIIYDGQKNYQIIIIDNSNKLSFPTITHNIPNVYNNGLIIEAIKKYDIMMPRWLILYMTIKEQLPKDIIYYLIINYYFTDMIFVD